MNKFKLKVGMKVLIDWEFLQHFHKDFYYIVGEISYVPSFYYLLFEEFRDPKIKIKFPQFYGNEAHVKSSWFKVITEEEYETRLVLDS